MPQIESVDASLKSLQGIHLWHAALSSCSQRVRLALQEKGLSFESHEIDLQAGENASEAYQRIHPKGLVPAMVIDGDLFVESVDIILEIDRRFPQPPLMFEVSDTKAILERADAAHPSLKLLTFEFLFSVAPPPPRAHKDAFQRDHKNVDLKKFHADFAAGFERPRIEEAARRSMEDFEALESLLSDGRSYLAGVRFSLADIAWMPNVHRYSLFGWPFDRTPHLAKWFARMQSRSSYRQALAALQPPFINDVIVPKIKQRQRSGDGVETYGLL